MHFYIAILEEALGYRFGYNGLDERIKSQALAKPDQKHPVNGSRNFRLSAQASLIIGA